MTVSIAFSPRHAFAALYREMCYSVYKGLVLADKGSDYMLLPSAFANLVEDKMVIHFSEYRRFGSLMEVHRNTMRRHHERLSVWTGNRPEMHMPLTLECWPGCYLGIVSRNCQVSMQLFLYVLPSEFFDVRSIMQLYVFRADMIT